MKLTKEIIMSSLKGDLIEFCKEKDISYTKKSKSELQELLLETLNVLDIDSQEEIIDTVADEIKEKEKNITKEVIKKEEVLNAKYEYKPEKNEKLITDKPSKPLTPVSPFKQKVIEKPVSVDLNSNKSIYNNYLAENRAYKLIYNGNVVFDSTIHKGVVIFEEDYFSINGKQFDYKNLKFKFA